MPRSAILISFLAVIVSFIGGFLLANALNRGELDSLRSENERLKTESSTVSKNAGGLTLTSEEIQAKIAEADENPQNFQFQKNLGIALYRYAAMKQDVELLKTTIPILSRATLLNSRDYDVIVALGNAHFDVGYFNKDNDSLTESRKAYSTALEQRPNDVKVRTDIGLTYFLQHPPDYISAVEEFQRSLAINPKHEKTLQFIVQALAKQNKTSEAARYVEQLRAANPNNSALPELTALIAQQ